MSICKNCAATDFFYQISGPHLGQYCSGCKTWQKWIPQGPSAVTAMPWGKYAGKKITEIDDLPYLRWMSATLANELDSSDFKTRLAHAIIETINQKETK